MNRSRILVIDKDPVIRRFIKVNFEPRNYKIFLAADVVEALQLFKNESPDIVLLDSAPQGMDTLEICRSLRVTSRIPIIVLGSRSDELTIVRCFNAGADDYITKPFGIEELSARIRAVLRRSELVEITPAPSDFAIGDIKIRFAERQVTLSEHEVKLTPTEYNLLQELALNADKVLTHNLLLHKVWGSEYKDEREYLRVFIGRLRKKLESNPSKPDFIITVPWVGYKLKANNGNGHGAKQCA